MKIFYLLLFFNYINIIICIIPSSIPDCSLESPNIEYIYTIKTNDNFFLNQTWKIQIGERHFYKINQCFSNLSSFEVWLKSNVIGTNLCGYMGIKVHDGSYFNFFAIIPNETVIYKNLKIDKKYDKPIMSFAIGTNFKNYIKREGNLNKGEWLSLLNTLNTYYKNENNNRNRTIFCYKKIKEHFFLKNIIKEYTPSWFSSNIFNIFGYEYYIYGKPEEMLEFVEKKINNIGNEIFKKYNYTLNKNIGEYITEGNNNNSSIKTFQVNEKIIVNVINNGFKIKHCVLVDIKKVLNKIDKCGEKLMVYTNYGIRFYDVNLQTLILPEDIENCDNKLQLKNVLIKENIISKESILNLVRFQMSNMDKLTIIIISTLIILFQGLIIITVLRKIYTCIQKKKFLYDVSIEEEIIIEDHHNENIVRAILV
ncbi:Hypothetical protein SRAE_1000213900 [Strongyloides ratti]|uniref:Uncharacterized protein n=1 Tax=Strongyloides ratti TaxID=34506 RepID=A0A090L6Y3_STRRB|nr:Hypothetical protein SRAE_1000213900 [Strongyloides ratti]CEF63883.1 Hypothetical protein SRAE_1000213900 [Strongyloides ratti]